MGEKTLKDIVIEEIEKEDLCDCECGCDCEEAEGGSYEEALEYLSFVEEQKRIALQDNPVSKASKATKETNYYKNGLVVAETVGEIFKTLTGYGVDYQNALAFASAYVSNTATLEITKADSTKNELMQEQAGL